MKKIILITVVSLISFLIWSCDDANKYFEDERYIKESYIISDVNNFFHAEYLMDGQEYSRGNLSIGVSGTNPIDKSVTFQLDQDESYVAQFNRQLYLDDISKYNIQVDASEYVVASKIVTIEAGVNPNSQYGLMNIDIKQSILDSFSPDSIYLIGFKLVESNPYPVKKDKNRVLFRIYKKNKYASMRNSTFYVSNGFQGNGYFGVQKQVHPLTSNSCRITVGSTVYNAGNSLTEIIAKSMVVSVGVGNSVSFSTYKGGVVVEALKPSDDPKEASFYYRNVYNEDENTFYLYYRYSTNGGLTFTAPIMEMLKRDI